MHRPAHRPPVDEHAIVRFGERQHRQLSVAQLEACGLSPAAIRKRCEAGRLHRTYRGAYSLGVPAGDPVEKMMAAALACEPCLVSHFSCAWLFQLDPDPGDVVHVTVPRAGRTGPEGIVTHRPRRIDERDRTEHRGLPVTTPSRVLVDLAGMVSRSTLVRLVRAAEFRRLLDRAELARCIERAGRRPGVVALRDIASLRATQPVMSTGEAYLCDLLAYYGAPTPLVNHPLHVGRRLIRPDLMWPDERLVFELDGKDAHGEIAGEHDAIREAELVALGLRVERVTGVELARAPDRVVRRILNALAEQRMALAEPRVGLGPLRAT